MSKQADPDTGFEDLFSEVLFDSGESKPKVKVSRWAKKPSEKVSADIVSTDKASIEMGSTEKPEPEVLLSQKAEAKGLVQESSVAELSEKATGAGTQELSESETPAMTRRQFRELREAKQRQIQEALAAKAKVNKTKSESVELEEEPAVQQLAESAVVISKPRKASKKSESGEYAWVGLAKSIQSKKEAGNSKSAEKQLSKRAIKRSFEKVVKTQTIKVPTAPVVTTKTKTKFTFARFVASAAAVTTIAGFAIISSVPNLGNSAEANVAALGDIQTFTVANDEVQVLAVTPSESLTKVQSRDNYTAVSLADIWAARWAAIAKGYVNNSNSPIQWPFNYTVNITSYYGMRNLCGNCAASFHPGIDFGAGRGAVIQAIADGTVEWVYNNPNGDYGVHVLINHGKIDGQTTYSLYAHMITGSVPLKVGQKVEVGDFVGQVGNTGYSFGAHLHLEIWQDRHWNRTDPWTWLKKNAGG